MLFIKKRILFKHMIMHFILYYFFYVLSIRFPKWKNFSSFILIQNYAGKGKGCIESK